jgi:hypothetical protein
VSAAGGDVYFVLRGLMTGPRWFQVCLVDVVRDAVVLT